MSASRSWWIRRWKADFGGLRVAVLVLVVDPTGASRVDPVRLAQALGLTPCRIPDRPGTLAFIPQGIGFACFNPCMVAALNFGS